MSTEAPDNVRPFPSKPGIIKFTPTLLRDPKTFPRRQFVYGKPHSALK